MPPLPLPLPWRPSRVACPPPSWQVTCNYAARQQGVTKLMGTAEARKRCPHIALVRWVLQLERLPASRGWVSQGPACTVGMATVVGHLATQLPPTQLAYPASGAGGAGLATATPPAGNEQGCHCWRIPVCCPCSGEDLTPYRAASQSILAVLRRYGTAEKGGLDEFWVDATSLVGSRAPGLAGAGQWVAAAHVCVCVCVPPCRVIAPLKHR